MKNKFFLLTLLSITLTLILGCQNIDKEKTNNGGEANMILEQLEMPKDGEEIAVIETNLGEIKIRLFEEVAPKAVENFKTLSRDGYYEGIIFHRVMDDFMIQGGDPTGTGRGGNSIWNGKFEDEFHPNYHNFRGALSMANSGPNTNGSQFFIVQNPKVSGNMANSIKDAAKDADSPELVVKAYEELGGTPWLDFNHTVFGQVFQGMDVVDKIAGVEVDRNDRPLEDVIIEKINIVEYKK